MSGENDSEVVGYDVGDVIEITVLEPVAGLAIILDITTSKYIWIDESGKVLGRLGIEEPYDIKTSIVHFIRSIHKPDNINVCVLNDNRNWTPIVTAPSPPPSVADYKKKYWQFEAAESNFTNLILDEERAPLVGS
ncbi:hypothetical protein DEU56DRAFT_910403 [Suillus clintonianus]|uniref:uncharacterized protein n=1 Tax=Suillus clintonianus TaxID=1904413 RepID=UPI001B87FB60|nr:uncharacterized protein DEU56DRAFT_910403 [Suillus clintonianus]KAG2144465.1 hypothetical protein DEU56DRAFT_910403 [Suillus clintonianus]